MTDFWTIASTALGTGLATAIFNQGFSWWRDYSKEKTTARYLAVRLAITLEKYALDCADCIGSAERRQADVKLPDLPAFPDEDSWKSLDPHLLEKALSLAHEITLSRQYIVFEWEVGGDPTDDEAVKQYGKCAFIAWRLAAELRTRYGLSPFDPLRTGWDIGEFLLRYHAEVLAEARARNSK